MFRKLLIVVSVLGVGMVGLFAASGVGILPSGKLETDASLSAMIHPAFQARVHTAIWLCLVVGAGLVFLSYRRVFEWRKTWARWSQFSLAALLVLIAMTGVFFGGWVAREFLDAMGR